MPAHCWLVLCALIAVALQHNGLFCVTGPGGAALSAHKLSETASVVAGDDKRKRKAEVTCAFQREAADGEIGQRPWIVNYSRAMCLYWPRPAPRGNSLEITPSR